MLARKSGEFDADLRGARHVAAHDREQGRAHSSNCARADMGEARDPRLSVADEGNRAPDVAQWPQREREMKHRCGRRRLVRSGRPNRRRGRAETRRVRVPGDRGLAVLAGEPVCLSGHVEGDAGFGRRV